MSCSLAPLLDLLNHSCSVQVIFLTWSTINREWKPSEIEKIGTQKVHQSHDLQLQSWFFRLRQVFLKLSNVIRFIPKQDSRKVTRYL
jgi:hypothetical protein